MRLKEFQKLLNIKQIDLAKLLNTNPGFISQLMTGTRKITVAFAYEIGKRYSWFNPDWLITGEGEMRKSEKNADVLLLEPGPIETSEDQRSGCSNIDPAILLGDALRNMQDRIAALEGKVEELKGVIDKLREN
jgi:transcriptional regulator with XRE-family HTH domain